MCDIPNECQVYEQSSVMDSIDTHTHTRARTHARTLTRREKERVDENTNFTFFLKNCSSLSNWKKEAKRKSIFYLQHSTHVLELVSYTVMDTVDKVLENENRSH